MAVNPIREITKIPDKTFPINIFRTENIAPHWHDHLEWIYVEAGVSRLQIDGDFVDLHENEVAFVNSKQIHSAVSLQNGTSLVAIVFNEALVRNSGLDHTEERYFAPILTNRLRLPNFLQESHPLTQDICAACTRLVREFERGEVGFELFIKAELFRVFGLIYRWCNPQPSQSRGCQDEVANFTSLLRYLRENYASAIRVSDAAKQVNLSPNHFCKVFKKLTGKTLVEYLQILRVTEAERLLMETDMSIAEIACEVGFSNLTYFGRIFKKYKNTTPTDLRARSRKKQENWSLSMGSQENGNQAGHHLTSANTV